MSLVADVELLPQVSVLGMTISLFDIFARVK